MRLPEYGSLNRMQKAASVLTVVAVLGLVFISHVSHSFTISYSRDGRYDMGVMLREYRDRGYTIATTEAGLVPLYSGWRAVDTWGLNDQWIAHNGGVTEEYLSRQSPDIILWHEYFSPLHPPSSVRGGEWFRQVMVLKKYAESNDYTLAAVFGVTPDDTHYYYVRSKIPDHDEIVKRIRALDYAWYHNGQTCENYAEPLSQGDSTHAQQGAPADAVKPLR